MHRMTAFNSSRGTAHSVENVPFSQLPTLADNLSFRPLLVSIPFVLFCYRRRRFRDRIAVGFMLKL